MQETTTTNNIDEIRELIAADFATVDKLIHQQLESRVSLINDVVTHIIDGGGKRYGGQKVLAGNIIVRQRGTKFHAGPGARLGRDHTVFAIVDGFVQFVTKGKHKRKYVTVVTE